MARRLWIIAVAVVATAGLEVWIGVAGSRPSPIVTVGLLATLVIVILTTCLQWYLDGVHAKRERAEEHASALQKRVGDLERQLRLRTKAVLSGAHGAEHPNGGAPFRLDRAPIRTALVDALNHAAASAGVLIVRGEPDVGKSALTLEAVDDIRTVGGHVVAVSLYDLDPASVSAVEHVVGTVPHDADASSRRLLLVDGAEAVLQGRADLLRVVADAAKQAGVGVVVVTRDDAYEAVWDSFAIAGSSEDLVDCGDFRVDPLAAGDLTKILERFPELRGLADDPRSELLLGRPGLVDLLLRGDAVVALPDGSLAESDVLAAVWSRWVRRDDVRPAGGPGPDEREGALLTLAAHQLHGGPVSGRDRYVQALPSLRSDGILLPTGDLWVGNAGDDFACDLVRDMAVAQLLVSERFGPLEQAGAPRWALRAARLACQAALRSAAGPAVQVQRLGEIRSRFDTLAHVHGERWRDLPWEAVLTCAVAGDLLTSASTELLTDQGRQLMRVLHIVEHRYSRDRGADPVIGGPVVAFTLDTYPAITAVGGACRDAAVAAVVSWLRELARMERGLDPARVEAWRPLRRRARAVLLAAYRQDQRADLLEALALLGSELNAEVAATLRAVAADTPHRLAPCVDRTEAAMAVAAVDPGLLADLTRAYYIENHAPDPRRKGFSAVRGGGIRLHEFRGGGPRSAGWFYGPFWALLQTAPNTALDVINELLEHALREHHVRRGPLVDADAARQASLSLAILGNPPRAFTGDPDAWRWYRGSGNGPDPCISALLAVERWADQRIRGGQPLAQVAQTIVDKATTIAMPGLVLGLLVRHFEQVSDEADGFLPSPEVWELEVARVTTEGLRHAQGGDDADVPGRDRRTLDPQDIACELTVRALRADDQQRMDQLRRVGQALMSAVEIEAAAHPAAQDRGRGESPEQPGQSERADTSEVAEGQTHAQSVELAIMRQRASLLDAACYTRSSIDGQAAWLWQPPPNVTAALEGVRTDADRAGAAYRLHRIYTMGVGGAFLIQPPPIPDSLTDDVRLTRDLLANPPTPFGPRMDEVEAGVAAATVRAVVDGAFDVPAADRAWAVDAVLRYARRDSRVEFADEDSRFSSAADRSAATAVPLLLAPHFTDPPAGHLQPEDPQGEAAAALATSATNNAVEVRQITALAIRPVWQMPCGPCPAASPTCRHTIALNAVEADARSAILTPPDMDGVMSRAHLTGDLPAALAATPTDQLVLDWLVPAATAACHAAASRCCIAQPAAVLRDALLAAYTRAAVYRNGEDFDREEDHTPLADALLTTANTDPRPLFDLVRAISGQARAIDVILDALTMAATYRPDAPTALKALWPQIMTVILDAADNASTALTTQDWSDYAVAAMLPVRRPNPWAGHVAAVLAAALGGWPSATDLTPEISRWLPYAAGRGSAVDALICLLEPLPTAEKAELGLPWIRSLLLSADRKACRTSRLAESWLVKLRDEQVLDSATDPVYYEVLDALAAAGRVIAVALQRRDEHAPRPAGH